MKLEILDQAIQALKISNPRKLDLQARLKRVTEETDELDRGFLLEDLRQEVKRLAGQVVTFTDLYDKPRERTGQGGRVGKGGR